MADIQRTKPFSVEAEQSVLGSVLIDPEKLTDIVTDMLVLRAETDMNREELSELFNFSEPTVAELETY